MAQVGIENNEDLRGTKLDRAGQSELLNMQSECTVVFADDGGWPSGVVMSFVEIDGDVWLTSVEGRAQTRAVAADPRVGIIISNAGTSLPGRRMLALRGTCTLHRDAETKARFFGPFAAKLAPNGQAEFIALMDSPQRVIFQVEVVAVALSHDSRRTAGDGRGGKRSEN